jgi:hypothetical protein
VDFFLEVRELEIGGGPSDIDRSFEFGVFLFEFDKPIPVRYGHGYSLSDVASSRRSMRMRRNSSRTQWDIS